MGPGIYDIVLEKGHGMKRIPLLLLVFIVVSLPTSPWGLTTGDYEKQFDGYGKELIIDWGVFGSIEERDRLEKQLEVIWEAFERHRDEDTFKNVDQKTSARCGFGQDRPR